MADPGYDAIYLSPHLDDAALSCGGQIAGRVARGERVLIVTIFTADVPPAHPLSAFARQMLASWALDRNQVMATRRSEDRAACAVLGADHRHLDLLDAMFRSHGDRPTYATWRAVRTATAEREPHVTDQLRDMLRNLPGAPFVAMPLGAGHVDHRIVRAAAEGAGFGPLVCYADLPYALGRRSRWRALGCKPWHRGRIIAISAGAREARSRALACYASQGGATLVDTAEAGLRAWGGERCWTLGG